MVFRLNSAGRKRKIFNSVLLDCREGDAISRRMPIFQSKVRLTAGQPRRWLAIALTVGIIAGCSSNTTKANAAGQQAQAMLDAGDLPGARAAIGRALALRGDQVDLLLLDGRIKYRLNDFGAAFTSYNMALAIDPMNPEALQGVSQLGSAIGNEVDSVAAAERILTVDPNDTQALLVKGMQLLNRRDYAGAEKMADRILAADPQGEIGPALKARALVRAGKEDEAMALLNAALKRAGPNRMLATAMLETARDRGDAAVMLEQYRTLADLVPKNVDLAIDEANVQYKLGHGEAARERGWALLSDNGADETAVRRLIDLWTEYDRTPLTPDRVASFAESGPAPARLMVARFYLGVGDTRAAMALVGTLMGFEASGLRVRIGYAKGEAGAAGVAEQVLASDTTNCDALSVRATEAVRQGRPGDAVNAAQQAAAECPDRDGAGLLARAYAAKGDEAAVRRAYLDGIEARPLSTAAAAAYADWLTARRQVRLAIDVARSLTQRAPAKVSAWRLLKAACARAGDSGCAGQARAGEAAALRNFAIDLPPGQRRANPLLGNLWQ